MGACDISFTLPGTATHSEIRAAFKQQQEDDRHANGNGSYTGDFQTVSAVDIRSDVFDSQATAMNFCLDNAKKWATVIAVRYKSGVVVEWTARTTKLQGVHADLEHQAQTAYQAAMADARLRIKDTQRIKCTGCGSTLTTEFLKGRIDCPVCRKLLASKQCLARYEKLKAKKDLTATKLHELQTAEYSKAAAKSNETTWLIAGWGAC